ncbi:hypothetical protein LINGRAHAP2_LOCUS4047 [Linum grandiflorum]
MSRGRSAAAACVGWPRGRGGHSRGVRRRKKEAGCGRGARKKRRKPEGRLRSGKKKRKEAGRRRIPSSAEEIWRQRFGGGDSTSVGARFNAGKGLGSTGVDSGGFSVKTGRSNKFGGRRRSLPESGFRRRSLASGEESRRRRRVIGTQYWKDK